MKTTRAITHICLDAANAEKLSSLDAVAAEYMALCQSYVDYFCTEAEPDKYAPAHLSSPLSARWQRQVIQQAAGIAKFWRTNKEAAEDEFADTLADYLEDKEAGTLQPNQREPHWKEWNVPKLKATSIQANANVALLEASTDSSFDYWLKISTLERGKPIRLPVKLAAYHERALGNLTPNSSVTLTRNELGWWLTLTVDEDTPRTVDSEAEVEGADVCITNFITSSSGQHYGTISDKLKRRMKYERMKRRRKSKLRACLKKQGVENLPSVANPRLGRHVRQEINRAVNQFYADHRSQRIAIEALNVKSMKFKARAMNAYLYASNLAHIPRQLEWGARKRGVPLTHVKAAYTSQCCSQCYYVDRGNRPNQQTFCCKVCGYATNADINAASNIKARVGDREISACRDREELKTLLLARHALRVSQLQVVQLPAQLTFGFAGVG